MAGDESRLPSFSVGGVGTCRGPSVGGTVWRDLASSNTALLWRFVSGGGVASLEDTPRCASSASSAAMRAKSSLLHAWMRNPITAIAMRVLERTGHPTVVIATSQGSGGNASKRRMRSTRARAAAVSDAHDTRRWQQPGERVASRPGGTIIKQRDEDLCERPAPRRGRAARRAPGAGARPRPPGRYATIRIERYQNNNARRPLFPVFHLL